MLKLCARLNLFRQTLQWHQSTFLGEVGQLEDCESGKESPAVRRWRENKSGGKPASSALSNPQDTFESAPGENCSA